MKNKYYTPTIEEFHVGFEYEAKGEVNEYTLGKEHFVVGGWKKLTFPDLYSGYNLPELFKTSFLRIKHLDQEDLEEVLGTKQLKGDENDLNFQLTLSDYLFYEIDYELDDKTFTVEEFTGDMSCGYSSRTIFRGFIKNKSELKKLLKQLNIV